MGIDDLLKEMEEDERRDKAELLKKMSPIEYGRLRGIAPQRVYQKIRTGKLAVEYCVCGRKVIDVSEADMTFDIKVEIKSPVEASVDHELEVEELQRPTPDEMTDSLSEDTEQEEDCAHYGVECETDENGRCTSYCHCDNCMETELDAQNEIDEDYETD